MSKRANGEGSISKYKDGRWVGRITLQNGKRKAFYGSTRQEVATKLAAGLKHLNDNLPIAGERETVRQFLTSWLESSRPSLRPRTYATYEIVLRLHAFPNIGKHRLANLSPQHLQALYSDRLAAGLSPATVHKLHAIIHRALEQAVRWNLIVRNVAGLVTPPRIPRHEMKTLDGSDARKFLDRSPDGFVISEPKTVSSRRQIALGPLATESLRRHRTNQAVERLHLGPAWHDNGLVFPNEVGRPLEASNLRRRSFEPLVERAALPKIRFHDLRHSAATLLLSQGVHPKIVFERLGHSQVGITLNLYSHVTPTLQRQAAEAVETLLKA